MHLEEFLRHVSATTLVDNVYDGKKSLERDYERNEETHAGGRSGDS